MNFVVFEKEIQTKHCPDKIAIDGSNFFEVYESVNQHMMFNCIGHLTFIVDKLTMTPVHVCYPMMGFSHYKIFETKMLDKMFESWSTYKTNK